MNLVILQGAWAFKYWNFEENFSNNLEHLLTLMAEVVEVELKELTHRYSKYVNPITYWQPSQGEIQADFHLPFEMKNLTELPNLNPLVARWDSFKDNVIHYLPNETMWESVEKVRFSNL